MQALAGGAAMNRVLILLLSGVLASALPGVAVAGGQQAAGTAFTKLMVLFSWSASRFEVPKRVVAPDKDWSIVQNAQEQRAARLERERRLREARERIVERERELRLAREAYRRETSRMIQEPKAGPAVAATDRAEHNVRLLMAERRLSEREMEAYKAKLEYSRAARAVREQRRFDERNAEKDG